MSPAKRTPVRREYRVRWRRPWWEDQGHYSTRLYQTEAAALRFATRLEEHGEIVIRVDVRTVGEWSTWTEDER